MKAVGLYKKVLEMKSTLKGASLASRLAAVLYIVTKKDQPRKIDEICKVADASRK